jgi:hypothetical protein
MVKFTTPKELGGGGGAGNNRSPRVPLGNSPEAL